MVINKKVFYAAIIFMAIGLIIGPVYGLRMKQKAEDYKNLSDVQEGRIANLVGQVEEKEKTVQGLNQAFQAEKQKLEQAIESHKSQAEEDQKKLAELSQANEELRQQNQTLIAKVDDVKTQTHELLTGTTELTSQLKRVKSEAEMLAEAKQMVEERLRDQKNLIESLKDEVEAGQVKIAEYAGRTTVRMEEKILFESSQASVKTSGLALLKKVGEALRQVQNKHIQVQGHTDSRPIRWDWQMKYPTNWELSASRATSIVRYLADEVGIEPTRLSAAGYSFYQPVASNDTPEGRQENRRVEFVLLPLRGK